MWEASPAVFRDVTPDGEDIVLDPQVRALYFGTTGNVVLEDQTGTQTTFGVAVGEVVQLRPKRIIDSGTTCTQIIALY